MDFDNVLPMVAVGNYYAVNRSMQSNTVKNTYKAMTQLRRIRQPCSKIGCKNPAHEDGYCDTCRPFAANNVPFRMDWIRGENLLKDNRPVCLYTRQKPEGNWYRINSIREEIESIRRLLNE